MFLKTHVEHMDSLSKQEIVAKIREMTLEVEKMERDFKSLI